VIKAMGDRSDQPYAFEIQAGDVWNPGSADFLEAFSMALCIVTSDLLVVTANASAKKLFSGSDAGLRNLVKESEEGNSAFLQKQIVLAICNGSRTSLVLRTPQAEFLILTVRPVRSARLCLSLIAILPLSGAPDAVIPHLRSIYKLSPAEAEIAAAAASGLEIVEIANSRGVSMNTLRAQIASMKSKMGVTRLVGVAILVSRIHAASTWL
jgi:DNA-binding NarL/FixJ family response regulator